jgi:hypothetical protein
MFKKIVLSLILAVTAGFISSTNAAETIHVAIFAPDMPFTQAEGDNYIGQFINILAGSVGLKPENFKGRYFNDGGDVKKFISQNKNVFVMGSLSFFLPNRNWLKLVPVASIDYAGSDMEKYYLTVQKGKYKKLEDLKGKTVAGNVFKEDSRFIKKFIFNGRIDAYSYFNTTFTTSVRGSVRNVQKGKLDAILLNHRDYIKFKSRKDFESLEIIYESESIPALGLMMNDSPYNRSMKEKFLNAVLKMNSMQEAQTMFNANGMNGFRKLNTGLIDNAISKFDSGN